jgi:hypothetical protein
MNKKYKKRLARAILKGFYPNIRDNFSISHNHYGPQQIHEIISNMLSGMVLRAIDDGIKCNNIWIKKNNKSD